MKKKYLVAYEWAGKNFSGYAPHIAGCIATAKTLPLVRSKLKGALESHLEWMHGDGDPIPVASDEVTVDMQLAPEFPKPRGYCVIVERLSLSMPMPKAVRPRPTTAVAPKD